MFHPRHFGTRFRTTFGAALALLILVTLPAAPGPTHAARRARAEDQNAQFPSIPPGQAYRQRNLVSSIPGLAYLQDPNVVSPWGLWISPGVQVVDRATGTALQYTIFLPPNDVLGGTPGTASKLPGGPPTGVMFPVFENFPHRVVFTTTGNVLTDEPVPSGLHVAASYPGHVYTGATYAEFTLNNSNVKYLYAADFANCKVDVFDTSYVLQTSGFPFTDPTIPPGYCPYNVQHLRGAIFVTYALNSGANVALTGPGTGYVRTFGPNGVLSSYFKADGGPLNAPWGVTISSSEFGTFKNKPLVGNSGDGTICVFDYDGTLIDRLRDEAGQPIVIDGLRSVTMAQFVQFSQPLNYTVYFTSDHGLIGSLVPTTSTATSLVQLAGDSFSIGEGAGHIDITATRVGDASGAATVRYAAYGKSKAGAASQQSDFELAAGILSFAPGETSKTFRVLVVNDNLVEGAEAVSLALSNPEGAGVGLGSPNTAELKILDNDAAPSASNPVDDTAFFVRQHYLDFLNREPDAAGLAFWTGEIERCGADAQCREVKRVNVSAAFFLSIEFQRTGLLAYLTHKAVFGTRPSYGAFVRDVQPLQQNLVFGQPGFDAQLEANKRSYFDGFVQRPDYIRRVLPEAPADYVDALYQGAGVTPTAAERDAAIAEFDGAQTPQERMAARARALRRVAESETYVRAEFGAAFVTMEYFGYLRRDPDGPGFDFWLGKLNSFGGDYIRAEMVKAFINSDEYRHRFGP